MTEAPKRIWAAMPADGIMKPETMYGWTTEDHVDEWRDNHLADMECGGVDALEYHLCIPVYALSEAPEVQRLIDEAVEKATRVKPLRYFYPQGDTFGQMRDNARQHPLAKEGDMKLVWVNAGDLWNIVIRAAIGGGDE